MTKGYRFTAMAAGLSLIAGFFLPWFGKGSMSFSGLSCVTLGYFYLLILPVSGGTAIASFITGKQQKPQFLLFPGMAGILCLCFFVSMIVLNDSGPLQIDTTATSEKMMTVVTGNTDHVFNPLSEMGAGSFLTVSALLVMLVLPYLFKKEFSETNNAIESYTSIISKRSITTLYQRSVLMMLCSIVLIVTWVWCGISPSKLWENRGNAKEYLFGRNLSQDDLGYIQNQKERAPEVEAAGRANEYMANKYRDMPFSKQPDYEAKTKEKKAVQEAMLLTISNDEKADLKKEAEKNARIQKKGGYFPPETSWKNIKIYMEALLETFAMAIWGTLLALLCAIPVSFFAAGNTLKLMIPSEDLKGESLRKIISFGVRRVLDSCRGFNEFVMALIFVAVIGLGPYAGILALWIHTFGILGKVFSEQIEAIETGQMEALVSTGASPVQTISFSVMPQVMPGFVSYTLLRFESNVRSAAILGFVGAGGIGFLIFDKLNGYLFPEVCTMMIIIIITVGIIDLLCSRIRMRFI